MRGNIIAQVSLFCNRQYRPKRRELTLPFCGKCNNYSIMHFCMQKTAFFCSIKTYQRTGIDRTVAGSAGHTVGEHRVIPNIDLDMGRVSFSRPVIGSRVSVSEKSPSRLQAVSSLSRKAAYQKGQHHGPARTEDPDTYFHGLLLHFHPKTQSCIPRYLRNLVTKMKTIRKFHKTRGISIDFFGKISYNKRDGPYQRPQSWDAEAKSPAQ